MLTRLSPPFAVIDDETRPTVPTPETSADRPASASVGSAAVRRGAGESHPIPDFGHATFEESQGWGRRAPLRRVLHEIQVRRAGADAGAEA